MSGPPPDYYLTPPANPPAPAPPNTAPGFAGAQAPAWQDPAAPKSTNPLIAFAMGGGAMSGQFGGPALWSIAVGVLGIGLPFFTPFYFRILPIAGIYTGVRAIMSGRLIGGAVGIVLNVVAGIMSLIASGLILK